MQLDMMAHEEVPELVCLDPETAARNRRIRRTLLSRRRLGITIDSADIEGSTLSREPIGVPPRILKIRESASTARQKAKEKLLRLQTENQELEGREKILKEENQKLRERIEALTRPFMEKAMSSPKQHGRSLDFFSPEP
mmetsp:Transcript_3267/g.9996  ORF Transcript_3267/g.9996 Transcript_3267/m.9996 type:complete len:139 (+) Transcript_3267:254-670(+)